MLKDEILPILTIFKPMHYYFHKYKRNDMLTFPGKPINSIGYIIKGNVRFTVYESELYAGPGDFIYQPLGIRYLSEWTGNPEVEFYGLDFIFNYSALYKDVPAEEEGNYALNYRFQVLPHSSAPETRHYFEQILVNYHQSMEGRLSAIGDFYHLLHEIMPYLSRDEHAVSLSPIAPAVEYINSHYMGDFDVPRLAKLCGFSESRFYTLFREIMKYTPVEYKNALRVSYAADLLRNKTMSIEQISQLLNFGSTAHFRMVFQKMMGIKPKYFRKNVLA